MNPYKLFDQHKQEFNKNRHRIRKLPIMVSLRQEKMIDDLANQVDYSFGDMVLHFMEIIYQGVIPEAESKIRKVYPDQIKDRTGNFYPRHIKMIRGIAENKGYSLLETVMYLMEIIYLDGTDKGEDRLRRN